MKAYVFPGQGSQHIGMGGELFKEFKTFTNEADKILGYSIEDLCLKDKGQVLGQTEYTQPALYVVNALSYFKKIKDTGRKPDYVGGHSLGEYNALLAAEVFDFATGLKLVKKRGELMSKSSNGGMAAVLGLDENEVKGIIIDNKLDLIDIANINSPSQIVISGDKNQIKNAQDIFEKAGALLYVVLNVSGAFHSRYMKAAKDEFASFLNDYDFKNPKIKIIANYTARPYQTSEIKKNMIEQITGSVKWTESIRYLMGKGVQDIEQVGPGTVLVGLVNEILKKAEPLVIDDEKEMENFIIMEEKEVNRSKEILHNEKTELQDTKIPENTKKQGSNQTMNKPIKAEDLGSNEFKRRYGLKYAYLVGGMNHGISSEDMVIKAAKAGMLGFFGTSRLELQTVDNAIKKIKFDLKNHKNFGMNLFYNFNDPDSDEDLIDLFLRNDVNIIEVSSYMTITQALIKFKASGLKSDSNNKTITSNKIIAKVSRADMAEMFLRPAPKKLLDKLVIEKVITKDQAEVLSNIPVADDVCVEGDSAGYTEGKSPLAILPTVIRIRERIGQEIPQAKKVAIGLAGGIGTPESAAAAFIMGADFILAGSLNQCTVEAAISNVVKEMLQQINVQDTDYVPAGNMLEMGNQVQVVKRGLFFHVRANKLAEIYRTHNSINQIDPKTITRLEEKYFKSDLESIYEIIKKRYSAVEVEKAENNPRYKMALIFRWYFDNGTGDAIKGEIENKLNFQIRCGSALGAFNHWVKDTSLENWQNRHVDEIGKKIIFGAAEVINRFYN